MRWTAAIVIATLMLWGCGGGQPQKSQTGKETEQVKESPQELRAPALEPVPVEQLTPPTAEEAGDPDEVGVIDTDYGKIVLEFFADVAPIHVANMKKLARAGFYDGTTFHRVVPGFVIQGGDPNSRDDDPRNDGLGGPPWHVKAEFNDRPHLKGTLSMARSPDPNSAGSQFFICLDRTKNLDNEYTVFGKVLKGIEVVDDIGREARDPRTDAAKPAVKIRSIRIVKRGELEP